MFSAVLLYIYIYIYMFSAILLAHFLITQSVVHTKNALCIILKTIIYSPLNHNKFFSMPSQSVHLLIFLLCYCRKKITIILYDMQCCSFIYITMLVIIVFI